ncbi:MAG: DUF4198 domain-containing protein [Sulfurospirillum sp.]|nr:DUF4198 domain-containing protein [Sulfurospirillum sp.]
MRFVLFLLLIVPFTLFAHFQVLLPSSAIITDQNNAKITLLYEFTHPFQQMRMQMQKPFRLGVFYDGKSYDMLPTIQEVKKDGYTTWINEFHFMAPAVYQFFVDPKPSFEPAEEKFIHHQTKVIIDAFESGENWDVPIGLKAEIIPLTRPYGLYSGNIFSAKVLYKGKVASGVNVEVELYNTEGYKAASNLHVTQVMKTDANGIFHFVMPKAGWWGFAALIEDDEMITKQDKKYPVELGAVLWIYANEGY